MKIKNARDIFQLLFNSAAIFSFWGLSVIIISNSLQGVNLYIVFGSPFIFCSFAYLISIFVKKNAKYLKLYSYLCLISVPFCFFGYTKIQSSLDESIQSLLLSESSPFTSPRSVMWSMEFTSHWPFILCLGVPFFLYSIYLSIYFCTQKENDIARIYISEVLGFATGLIITSVVLDATSFSFVMRLIIILLGISAVLLSSGRGEKYIVGILFFVVCTLSFTSTELFEPHRSLNWSARDYSNKDNVQELQRSWTSYAKVQHLLINNEKEKISIQEGYGHARIIDKNRSSMETEASIIAKIFNSKDHLVFFAGGGYDLVSIAKNHSGYQSVIGVEINPRVVDYAMNHKDQVLYKALKRPGVKMVNQDGRKYIESSSESYDLILYSWSGTSANYFSATKIRTTQYMFTKEAIQSAYKKLNSEGVLVFFGGPTISILKALMQIVSTNSSKNLKNSIYLAGGLIDDKSKIKPGHTQHILIVKKGVFSPLEEGQLDKKLLKFMNYEVKISPGSSGKGKYKDLKKYLTYSDANLANIFLDDASGSILPTALSDDNPYLNRFREKRRYFKNIFEALNLKNMKYKDLSSNYLREIIAIILSLIFFIVYATARFKDKSRRKIHSNILIANGLSGLVYSMALMILTCKYILYIGNPTTGMFWPQLVAFVTSAFCGLLLLKHKIPYRLILLFPFVFCVLVILFYYPAEGILSFSLSGLVYLFLLSLTVFFTSLVFTKNLIRLSAEQSKVIPLHLFANTYCAGIGTLLAPALMEVKGMIVVMVYCLFLVIILSLISFRLEDNIRIK